MPAEDWGKMEQHLWCEGRKRIVCFSGMLICGDCRVYKVLRRKPKDAHLSEKILGKTPFSKVHPFVPGRKRVCYSAR